MDIREISKNLNDFDENGCCLVENIISDDCRKLLVNLLALEELDKKWDEVQQVVESEEMYNTKSLNIVNQILRDKMRDYTKIQNLYPTYGFYRKYLKNQKLKKHTDRPE